MADELNIITVKAAPSLGDRVALSESHPAHPQQPGYPAGEVFIYGQDMPPVMVAETPAVLDALSAKPPRLIRLEGPALRAAVAASDAAAEQRLAARDAALAGAATGTSAANMAKMEARVAKAEDAAASALEKADNLARQAEAQQSLATAQAQAEAAGAGSAGPSLPVTSGAGPKSPAEKP